MSPTQPPATSCLRCPTCPESKSRLQSWVAVPLCITEQHRLICQASAKAAFPAWAALTAYQRQAYLLKLLKAMEDNANDLALILTAENGKPFAEAKGEIAYGAGFLSWFAAEAVRWVTSIAQYSY